MITTTFVVVYYVASDNRTANDLVYWRRASSFVFVTKLSIKSGRCIRDVNRKSCQSMDIWPRILKRTNLYLFVIIWHEHSYWIISFLLNYVQVSGSLKSGMYYFPSKIDLSCWAFSHNKRTNVYFWGRNKKKNRCKIGRLTNICICCHVCSFNIWSFQVHSNIVTHQLPTCQ